MAIEKWKITECVDCLLCGMNCADFLFWHKVYSKKTKQGNMKTKTGELSISSPAFRNEGDIPAKYTCDGEEISPPLKIGSFPEGTAFLALIMDDPDAPKGTFDHWLAWNIEPVSTIAENSNIGISGRNSAGKTGYHGPCPPSGSHRYYFRIYALSHRLEIAAGAGRRELEQAMAPFIISKGTLMGRYQRS